MINYIKEYHQPYIENYVKALELADAVEKMEQLQKNPTNEIRGYFDALVEYSQRLQKDYFAGVTTPDEFLNNFFTAQAKAEGVTQSQEYKEAALKEFKNNKDIALFDSELKRARRLLEYANNSQTTQEAINQENARLETIVKKYKKIQEYTNSAPDSLHRHIFLENTKRKDAGLEGLSGESLVAYIEDYLSYLDAYTF